MLKTAKFSIFIVFAALIVVALHYYLPSTVLVQVVGTEVKRVEKKLKSKKTSDICYVIARRLNDEKTLVFRNEDMPWPPYLKFDSSDLSGKAIDWSDKTPRPIVLLTYYGWRIPFLSMHPNTTSLKQVNADYSHIPWFNIIFISILVILFIFIKIKLGKKS